MLAVTAGVALSALFVATPNQCFVGHWRVVESSSFPRAGSLELHRNGSAEIAEFQNSPFGAVWKTHGDILEITLISRKLPELEEVADPGLSWRLKWKIARSEPNRLSLEGPINSNWPQGQVILVRK